MHVEINSVKYLGDSKKTSLERVKLNLILLGKPAR